jgi:MFS-type transporter involved in bile tolerance (Atg22 family)
MVGMSIEAIMATTIQPGQEGRVSAWFQAGNLGGAGVGGGLGLILLQVLPATWMSGAILGGLFMACCAALLAVPSAEKHVHTGGVATAIRGVFGDIREMVRTQGGVLSALLCALPVGTGAAAGVLTQAEVAAHWGAGDTDVALLQGVFAGVVTAVGCFAGGWLCDRLRPRTAYALIGLALALVAVLMAVSPATVGMYRLWSLVYSFGVGLAYSAFTAVVLNAMGKGSAATKYNLFASLSNFPIWWLGLVLGRVADTSGADTMLLAEAGIGVIGVATFFAATRVVQRTRLPA